jgi:hypothetical protein
MRVVGRLTLLGIKRALGRDASEAFLVGRDPEQSGKLPHER